MLKIMLISGTAVYTSLQEWEVRQYLQGGSKGGTFKGYEDSAGTIPILINAHSVEYIYE